MILTIIAGIVMSTMVATQVAPSIVEGVKVKKVQTQTINNQEVIFEAIKRYTTIQQKAPEGIDDLINAKYIDKKVVEDNGFGGKYEIKVFKELGVATITTTIEDPKAQEAFLNSFMGTSKPTRVGTTNNFQTKYVIPNEIMHGVNDEMRALREMLQQAMRLLKPGGRLVVMTYHSLEDRLVKNFFKSGNFEGTISQDFFGNIQSPFRLINNKVITPSSEEVEVNPRSRSAKLRIAEKL